MGPATAIEGTGRASNPSATRARVRGGLPLPPFQGGLSARTPKVYTPPARVVDNQRKTPYSRHGGERKEGAAGAQNNTLVGPLEGLPKRH